jgi:predicted N-acetyltransferase YhbS
VTTDLTIRPLTPELDWDQYVDLSVRAFGPQEESRIRANITAVVAGGRALGAFDGDRLAGTAVFYDLRQWWYGRAVPMAGVAGVKVAPEDRGRGIGRALMTALTELMTGRGYPLAVLYPATMSIYRSLGWEIAGHRQEAVVPARTLFALAEPDVIAAVSQPRGKLRRPDPGDAATRTRTPRWTARSPPRRSCSTASRRRPVSLLRAGRRGGNRRDQARRAAVR